MCTTRLLTEIYTLLSCVIMIITSSTLLYVDRITKVTCERLWYMNLVCIFGYVFIFVDNICPIICRWIRKNEINYKINLFKTCTLFIIFALYVTSFWFVVAYNICKSDHMSGLLIANLCVYTTYLLIPVVLCYLICTSANSNNNAEKVNV